MYFFTYQCYIFSGSQKNERRYNLEVGCGYGIPFFISLLTIIVEFSAEKCFPIKPRFGNVKCFFASKVNDSDYSYKTEDNTESINNCRRTCRRNLVLPCHWTDAFTKLCHVRFYCCLHPCPQ